MLDANGNGSEAVGFPGKAGIMTSKANFSDSEGTHVRISGHFTLETEDLVKIGCLTSDQQNKINCLQLHESHVIVVNISLFFFLLGI